MDNEELLTYIKAAVMCVAFIFIYCTRKYEDETIKLIRKCAPALFVILQVFIANVFLIFMIGGFGWLLHINAIISIALIVLFFYPLYKLINYIVDCFSNHEMRKWVSVASIIGVIACYVRWLIIVLAEGYWGNMEWSYHSYIIISVFALFCLYALFRYILKSIQYIIK